MWSEIWEKGLLHRKTKNKSETIQVKYQTPTLNKAEQILIWNKPANKWSSKPTTTTMCAKGIVPTAEGKNAVDYNLYSKDRELVHTSTVSFAWYGMINECYCYYYT